MHELSIMASLLDVAEEHARAAGAQKVLSIHVVVGERSSFVDDSLLFYFDALTPGRLAEGAKLVIRRTPMRFYCQTCERDYTPPMNSFRCPTCNTTGRLQDDGNACYLEHMEIET
ncbi:MAG: hydrogenase maturation nickel metallochaperone HypA [Chloroflexaceae bacterium]|nr:hydrogenase maturation nickel metallochaperone HypA [Chloroflexaceae bacterium]